MKLIAFSVLETNIHCFDLTSGGTSESAARPVLLKTAARPCWAHGDTLKNLLVALHFEVALALQHTTK